MCGPEIFCSWLVSRHCEVASPILNWSGEGDIRAQTQWVLDVLKKLLAEEGATFADWVEQTIYTTDITELQNHVDLFQTAFGEQGPNQTWAQVSALFVPGQMIEIKGIAVID